MKVLRYFVILALFGAVLVPGCGKQNPGNTENNGNAEQQGNTERSQVDGGGEGNVTPENTTTENSTTTEQPTVDNNNPPVDNNNPVDNNPPVDNNTPEPPPATGLTYHKDVRPIVENVCLNCHKKGGIGPFLLTEYKFVYGSRELIKKAVTERRMPPWQGGQNCNDYTNDISLTDKQIKTISDWVDQGAPEGDPKDFKALPAGQPIGLSRIDLTLKMKKAYAPVQKPDEYKCFVLDWTPTTVKYISGFQVTPGNPSIVHHVITYLAIPKDAAEYRKRDPDGNGFKCFGTPSGSASYRWLGVWAPGVPGSDYAPGTGIKVEPGSKIIVQVHYNVQPNTSASDQTSVDFKLEDNVKQEAVMVPYMDPQWTSGKNMLITKDNANAQYTFAADLLSLTGFLGLKELRIYSVMLHLHQLGKKASLKLEGGVNMCLLDIPRWDFNWQLNYHLKTPISMRAGTSLRISCSWDNSQANQPYVNGKQRQSQDVTWGDNTTDEMCLGVLYATCGDGTGNYISCSALLSLINP